MSKLNFKNIKPIFQDFFLKIMNVETNSSVHYELKMKLGKNSGLKMSFLEFFPAERLSVKSTSLCYNRPTVVLS